MSDERKRPEWVEEIEVAGEKLVEEVKRLAAEGKASRLRIYEPDGDIAVDIPLTVGAIAGGAVVIAAPGIDDNRVRRSELPMVWPKPGSNGPTAKR